MKSPQRARRHLCAMTIVCLICAAGAAVAGQPVVLEVPTSRIAMPLAVTIERVDDSDAASSWELVELDATLTARGTPLPVQLASAVAADGTRFEGESRDRRRQLLAIIPPGDTAISPGDSASPPGDTADGVRRFRLQSAETKPTETTSPASFRFEDVSDASLGLWQGDEPVLTYNHGDITDERVPEGDSRRRRGCYIHPVWGLGGEVITDDFPQDHYHHHGIFWAWPHVGIGDAQYDLWTYGDIQQRFVRWIHRQAGPVAALLAVENGWFVGERKVMIERVWMRTFVASDGRRALDISLTLIPVDRPVTLQGAADKSYGGLTMRFAPRDDKQTVITVPAGRASEDLPETPLRWADYTSRFVGAESPSGATVMIDPAHPDFPPTWLTRHYGALCVGYPGVEAKTFPPGEAFTLNYRVCVHDASAELVDIERDYDAYTSALRARCSQ